MTARSGRTLTAEYRRSRAQILAHSDLCHLCGHNGARTGDHIIAPQEWLSRYGTLAGVDAPSNIAPAHGTMGSGLKRIHNRCRICGQLCNQSRKNRPLGQQTRSWDAVTSPKAAPKARQW